MQSRQDDDASQAQKRAGGVAWLGCMQQGWSRVAWSRGGAIFATKVPALGLTTPACLTQAPWQGSKGAHSGSLRARPLMGAAHPHASNPGLAPGVPGAI